MSVAVTPTDLPEALPPFVQPSVVQLAIAGRIVDSHPVASAYAGSEWDSLSDDGQVWIAAIVREAMRPEQAEQAIRETTAEVLRWCKHVERFAYERVGTSLDASPHLLAAAARRLAALVLPVDLLPPGETR